MRLIVVINLLTLLLITNCKFSFFVNDLRPISYYKCIKASTEDKVTLPLDYNKDDFDNADLENIQNALAANMAIELISVPYRCRTVQEEINFVLTQIDIKVINRFWVILGAVDQCSWQAYSPEENCQYLQELIRKWKAINVQIQIVSFTDCWEPLFGRQNACPQPSTTSLLWWLSQDPYQPTGSWQSPNMTFVTLAKLCGEEIFVIRINLNQNLRIDMI